MSVDLDNIALSSTTAALRNFGSGIFTVTVSGNIGAGLSGTWLGSTTFARTNSQVRVNVQQSTVPAAGPDYTASELLPCPSYGSFGFEPLIFVGCSVAGDPSVTSVDAAFNILSTATDLSATITIFNLTGGIMTLTNTVFTFRYVAFLPTT